MKKIIYIIFSLFIAINSFAQSRYNINNLTPFVGNWEWVNGNETFKVQVYIENGDLKGDYSLVESNNGFITNIIYESNKLLNPSLNFYYGYAISGGSLDGILFGASIDDNVLLGTGPNDYKTTKMGSLEFIITNDGSNGQSITATWKVSILQGLKSTDEPPNFSIPTDIVLTKVD